jgi:branched-chain amino acid transport system permease protein
MLARVAASARQRQSRSTLFAALAVAIFIGYVIQASWAGNAITFDSLLFFVVVGVTLGSIYAVAACGLVVTYTTSGIFNFAQGAIGMIMAFVYWELKVHLGLPTLLALALTLLVAAPMFGALVERLFMRRLADAPLLAKLVVTIGLLLALIGIALTIWSPETSRNVGTFFGTDGFTLGQTFVPWYRLITIVSGLAVALGLRALLFHTRLGTAMRAAVDDRDLAALHGVRPARVSMLAWALGSSMAALAGILLAEELSALSVQTLTLLIVDAFAAAIIGRLRNLPVTYVGGIIIGLAISFQQNFLTWSGRWTSAAIAIPTVILFLALLFLPHARIEGRVAIRGAVPRVPRPRTALAGFGALFVAVVVLGGWFGRGDVRTLTLVIVTSVILLSYVPLTGWAGQISLAQITFAGVGAFAIAEWGSTLGTVGALVVAAALAVPFGVLMALPALRLQGLYLALASMAFARLAEFVFFDQPEVFGNGARRIAPLHLLGFDFSKPFTILGLHFGADVGMLFLSTALFGVVGMAVVLVRRAPLGRRLVAMRDSPAGCATMGMNLNRTKLIVFAISAAIAGFGGGLLGVLLGSASTPDFQMLQGLPYLLLIVFGGVSVVSGALLGGFALAGFQTWLIQLFPDVVINLFNTIQFNLFQLIGRIGPGGLGIAIGRQPAGVIPTTGHDIRTARARRKANAGGADPNDPTTPSGGQPPSAPAHAGAADPDS